MSKRVFVLMSALFLVAVASLSIACGGNGGAQAAGAEDHRNAGNALVDKGDWQGAIGEYTLAIDGNPKSDLAYEGRGNAYAELGQMDNAISDLTKAIELAPSRVGPYYARGIVYRKTGEIDRAISDLSRAVGDRSKTKFRGALYERGLAYKASGNLKEARADFERIIQLEQENPGEADKSWVVMATKELEGLGR